MFLYSIGTKFLNIIWIMKYCMCYDVKGSNTVSRHVYGNSDWELYNFFRWHVYVFVCMCALLCVEVNVYVCKAQDTTSGLVFRHSTLLISLIQSLSLA